MLGEKHCSTHKRCICLGSQRLLLMLLIEKIYSYINYENNKYDDDDEDDDAGRL